MAVPPNLPVVRFMRMAMIRIDINSCINIIHHIMSILLEYFQLAV